MRLLISCMRCNMAGTPQSIAELLPNNLVKVNRSKQGDSSYEATVINGSDFELGCDRCGQVCLERKEGTNFVNPANIMVKEENNNFRLQRISGQSLVYTFGTIGLYAN